MFSTQIIFQVSTLMLVCSFTSGVPVEQKGYVMEPNREVQEPETRQGIIAGLIQNSQLFPIEINVPGAISNVTNGVQNFGQTVAEGIYIAGENVVAVSQILINSLGQRFPIINRLPFIGTQNNRLTPQEILVFIPPNKSDDVVVDSIPDPSELFTYP